MGTQVLAQGSRPWTLTKANPPGKKKKIAEIIHPLFETCTGLVTDEYWKNVFHQFAIGKPPKGFAYRDGLLSFRARANKINSIVLPEDPQEACLLSLDFMRTTGRLQSEEDKLRERMEIEQQQAEASCLHNLKWSELKKEKFKDMLLLQYISELGEEYHLEAWQLEQLRMLLHVGFCIGFLSKNDVVFTEGKVISIEGIQYDGTTGEFFIAEDHMKRKVAKSKNAKILDDDHFNPIAMWEEYISWLINARRIRLGTPVGSAVTSVRTIESNVSNE